jgi:hypothetical protein
MSNRLILPALPLRGYQRAVIQAAEGGCKRFLLAWHRRAGKTSALLALASWVAVHRAGTILWVARSLVEGRRIVWDGLGGDGRRLLEVAFPRQMVKSASELEMRFEFRSGGAFQVLGADEGSRLRGVGAVLIIIDELAFYSSGEVLDVARPIVSESGGLFAVSSTPNGRNWFAELADVAQAEPGWFYSKLTVDDTTRDAEGEQGGPVITPEQIAKDRKDGMRPELVAAEYYVSFDEPVFGAVFADELRAMVEQDRITAVPEYAGMPCSTAMDVGGRSRAAAVIFQQTKAGQLRVLEAIQSTTGGTPELVKELLRRPYAYACHFMPHDAEAQGTSGTSPQEIARDLGLRPIKIIPRAADVVHEIDQTRLVLPRTWIDSTRAAALVQALRHYEWDGAERRPKPSQWNHLVDAFRYAAMSKPHVPFEERQAEFRRKYGSAPLTAKTGWHTDASLFAKRKR